MTDTKNAIRARRLQTNKLIASHDAPRLRHFLDPKVNLIAGDGTLITGADAVISAFAAQFSDPTFITYVRTTDSIVLDQAGARASETGHWVGSWRSGTGETNLSGAYLAVWKKAVGKWVIESELYVSLAATAPVPS